MRVFIYEYLTAGELWSRGLDEAEVSRRGATACSQAVLPSADRDEAEVSSLLREGIAMLLAVAEDFSLLPEVEVVVMRDARLTLSLPPRTQAHEVRSEEQERELFAQLAAEADATLLIAPEFDQILLERARRAERVGARLLGPDSNLIALASDKQATAEHLAAAGVLVPRGMLLRRDEPIPRDFPFPAVIKPRDGAGSQGAQYLATPASSIDWMDEVEMRLEQFRPGTPASIALLCGPAGHVILPATAQHLSRDGRLRYLGGTIPLSPSLQRRAQTLARAAANSLPNPRGYIGLDIVLSASLDDDAIIEINPRLTTSYCGLRRLSHSNLARAMLAAAAGRLVESSFADGVVEFSADGHVRGCST